MKRHVRNFTFMAALLGAAALAGDTAELYFLMPEDGAVVKNPVRVVFGLSGMGIAPAGVAHPNTGHHHLVIDAPLPAAGKAIPANEHYRHFGGGQTETLLELSAGTHTLQLVLGDSLHVPHEPMVTSKKITIVVE
ncbi:MAG TPA: DUF4399 domain-containing protein [Gammaproteobacteria bacterium]